MLKTKSRICILVVTACAISLTAQQPADSGAFVLHKFAKAIGKETYVIEKNGDDYNLTSHFLFTDRGTPVSLETAFVARTADMMPKTYTAKGRAARSAEINDTVTVSNNNLSITRSSGQTQSETPSGPWFITDGYSPVAMQEQMMRWWLTHGKPAEFTVYPSNAKVRILPTKTLSIDGHTAHGYTVSGLIWGEESLWMDDSQNLIALVSTDAEFDHFEAVREPYATNLGTFIASAVQSDLAALTQLSTNARIHPNRH